MWMWSVIAELFAKITFYLKFRWAGKCFDEKWSCCFSRYHWTYWHSLLSIHLGFHLWPDGVDNMGWLYFNFLLVRRFLRVVYCISMYFTRGTPLGCAKVSMPHACHETSRPKPCRLIREDMMDVSSRYKSSSSISMLILWQSAFRNFVMNAPLAHSFTQ